MCVVHTGGRTVEWLPRMLDTRAGRALASSSAALGGCRGGGEWVSSFEPGQLQEGESIRDGLIVSGPCRAQGAERTCRTQPPTRPKPINRTERAGRWSRNADGPISRRGGREDDGRREWVATPSRPRARRGGRPWKRSAAPRGKNERGCSRRKTTLPHRLRAPTRRARVLLVARYLGSRAAEPRPPGRPQEIGRQQVPRNQRRPPYRACRARWCPEWPRDRRMPRPQGNNVAAGTSWAAGSSHTRGHTASNRRIGDGKPRRKPVEGRVPRLPGGEALHPAFL